MPELTNGWISQGHPLALMTSISIRYSLGGHLPVKIHCKGVQEHTLPIFDIGQLSLNLALDELFE
jgi:hypothetical protein